MYLYYTVIQWCNYGSCSSSFLTVPNIIFLFNQCWTKFSKNYLHRLQRPNFCTIFANSASPLNMYNKDPFFSMLENSLLCIYQSWISSANSSPSCADFCSFYLSSATRLAWGGLLPAHIPSPNCQTFIPFIRLFLCWTSFLIWPTLCRPPAIPVSRMAGRDHTEAEITGCIGTLHGHWRWSNGFTYHEIFKQYYQHILLHLSQPTLSSIPVFSGSFSPFWLLTIHYIFPFSWHYIPVCLSSYCFYCNAMNLPAQSQNLRMQFCTPFQLLQAIMAARGIGPSVLCPAVPPFPTLCYPVSPGTGTKFVLK